MACDRVFSMYVRGIARCLVLCCTILLAGCDPYGLGMGLFELEDKYVGEYKYGKRHGQGTLTYANGYKYIGEFRDGKRHGQGTYTFADGSKYVGEHRDGKATGAIAESW